MGKNCLRLAVQSPSPQIHEDTETLIVPATHCQQNRAKLSAPRHLLRRYIQILDR